MVTCLLTLLAAPLAFPLSLQAQTPSPAVITNPLPALPVSIWSRSGVTVQAVRFQGVTFSANNAIFAELQQKSGQPLDPDKVRVDLRRLYASGRYRDISVYGEESAGGLTLVFSGSPRYFIGRVSIEGVKQERLASLLERCV